MAKRVQDQKPARAAEARAWIQENVLEQKKRHAAIQKEMNAPRWRVSTPLSARSTAGGGVGFGGALALAASSAVGAQ